MKRFALLAAVALLPWPARAQGAGAGQAPSQQERARQQRDELDRIRRERAELERKARELRSTVHDLSEERSNLDRQADATARAVQEALLKHVDELRRLKPDKLVRRRREKFLKIGAVQE